MRHVATRLSRTAIVLFLTPFFASLLAQPWSNRRTARSPLATATDVQGSVLVKPVGATRWTPVATNLPLLPGDLVRTDTRGANAVALRLDNDTDVILGPGALLELATATRLALFRGEAEIAAPKSRKVKLCGHRNGPATTVDGTTCFRAAPDTGIPTVLDAEPNWLQGYKNAGVTEAMGSLLANVDGRNLPLTVGYHKVTVDIRDQIARTVIEESFVNRTSSRLEGVFYFPLPQDASISGFGMWINGELVEADVVEKQRAREIYETILREKRDPGLLEWTGGNIFKARVFPIFAHSEKRITITYTQVLPMRNGCCRYRYALRSELLQKHPLRELDITVNVSSAIPLKRVACPSHKTRVRDDRHTARIEYSAQEISPERDFELELHVDAAKHPVVFVPHRRGDDGYFLLLLNAANSAPAGRDLVAEGDPLDLVVLADTSGSMSEPDRAAQDAFLAALLGALGETDQFSLAACDVDCAWFRAAAVPATEQNTTAARDFLAARESLGWSDLDRTFAAAARRAGPTTHVVYIGDGVVTTGDCDPVAFAKRLRARVGENNGAYHAVAPGSSFESVVMTAIATLGNGSWRSIEGADGPQAAACELLAEITRPALKDLQIAFDGFRAARVYPAQLPNLPDGMQQIILGRYLPEHKRQRGTITVTGQRDGKPVRFREKVSFDADERGNSFIPRLWARQDLEWLLGQGRTPEAKADIIALSEEYQIITPYTSLLVLESDADRERFGVKRRFRMRDGEKFFAEGRDAVTLAVLKKQIKLAGTRRVGMQKQVLQRLAALGRDLPLSAPTRHLNMVPGKLRGRAPLTDAKSRRGYGGWKRKAKNDGYGDDDFDDASTANQLAATPPADTPLPTMPIEEAVEEDMGETPAEIVAAGAPAPPQPSVPPPMQTSKSMTYGPGMGARADQDIGPHGRRRIVAHDDVDAILPPLRTPQPDRTGGWQDEIRDLVRSLQRFDHIAALPGGVEVLCTSGPGHTAGRKTQLRALIGKNAWIVDHARPDFASELTWRLDDTRGTAYPGFGLGQVRAATQADHVPVLRTGAYILRSVGASVPAGVTLQVGKTGADTVLLVIAAPEYEMRLTIDTARHVLLRQEERSRGDLLFTRSCDDFVHLAGAWWPRTMRQTIGNSESVTAIAIRELDAAEFAERLREKKRELDGLLLARDLPAHLGVPQTQPVETKSPATFTQCLHALRLAIASNQPDHVDQAWTELAATVDGKPGLAWLELWRLSRTGDADKLALAAGRTATRLVANPRPDEATLADRLLNLAARRVPAADMLPLMDALKPIYYRQDDERRAAISWQLRRTQFQRAKDADAADKALGDLAAAHAANYSVQQAYVQRLTQRGEHERIAAWTEELLDLPAGTWADHQQDWLWAQAVSALQNQSDSDAALAALVEWLAARPKSGAAAQRYVAALSAAARHAELAEFARSHLAVLRVNERDSFAQNAVNILINASRFELAARVLTSWVALAPASLTPYQQHLYLLSHPREDARLAPLLKQWLTVGPDRTDFPHTATATQQRRQAAVLFALGQQWNRYTHQLDARWTNDLAAIVRMSATDAHHASLATQIMAHGHFRNTDAARTLRREALAELQAGTEALPLARIRILVDWVLVNDPPVEADTWTQLSGRLEERWAAEPDDATQHSLAQPLCRILDAHGDSERYLAFLRRQWRHGPAPYRATYAQQLFNALLSRPWQADREQTAFELLPELGGAADTEPGLQSKITTLYRLIDRMLAARGAAAMTTIKDAGTHTPRELAHARREQWRTARRHMMARLEQEPERQPVPLAPWLIIERLRLAVRLGVDPNTVAAECWEVVGSTPAEPGPADTYLDRVLSERYLRTLEYLATRPRIADRFVQQLLRYYDSAIAAQPDPLAWKQRKVETLVALDRVAELESALRGWIDAGDTHAEWRRALGYLMAELNRLDEAVEQFSTLATDAELGPAELRVLAEWYLVLGRTDDRERTLEAALEATDEYILDQQLHNIVTQLQRRGQDQPPAPLDADTFRLLKVLFASSRRPQDHVWEVKQLYRATQDPRLFECIARGLPRLDPGCLYPLLQSIRSLLHDVRTEAATDAVLDGLATVRASRNAADSQRGFDLLEMMTTRRASEVQNAPDQYIERATRALQRACKGEAKPGERLLLAGLISGLGRIPHKPLADAQLRQLTGLYERETERAYDRYQIAQHLVQRLCDYEAWPRAITVFERAHAEYPANDLNTAHHRLTATLSFAQRLWRGLSYKAGLDLLEHELEVFRKLAGGTLPQNTNSTVEALIGQLETRLSYTRAEHFLLAEFARPADSAQAKWYRTRLDSLYLHALRRGGTVSLGRDQQLYEQLERDFRARLDTTDAQVRYELTRRLFTLYDVARTRKLTHYAEHLRSFVSHEFPTLLAAHRHASQYQDLIRDAANSLWHLASRHEALRFLIERLEGEPDWVKLQWQQRQDCWSRHGDSLASYRYEMRRQVAELEPRILAVACTGLRRELGTQQQRACAIYRSGHTYFWKEQADAFAAVAEQVLEENIKSSPAVLFIADYLWSGLRRRERAAAVLLQAWKRGILDEQGQLRVITYLHGLGRIADADPLLAVALEWTNANLQWQLVNHLQSWNEFARSIQLLTGLVERYPDPLHYRTALMTAYFRTEQPEKLLAVLDAADRHFHLDGRWQEHTMRDLAQACLSTQLYKRAAPYFREVIELHRRTQPNHGIGNGTLSAYYTGLARAYGALGETSEAVDAAAGAIMAWGRAHSNRQSALNTLDQVLLQAPDLDAYVRQLDMEVAKSGLENPVVRKALGRAYVQKRQPDKAVAQLQLALAAQPHDDQTHAALISAYDHLQNADAAIRQTRARARLSRRNLGLYRNLAERLTKAERDREAERARTTIVEMQPTEAESHTMLAEMRQQQDRWADAILHWSNVARIRALEPTGLLHLAEAQLHEQRWTDARETLARLTARSWPSRFGRVHDKAARLEERIPE